MSSGEDYASSSSDDDDDDDDDESDYEAEGRRPAPKRKLSAGRGGGGSPASRRNARRYTTADIDREIAAHKDDGDGGGSSSGDGDGDSDAAEDDSDFDEKPKPKQGNARKGAIKSPVRRTGAKQAARKVAPPKRGGGKSAAKSRSKKNLAASNSEEEEEASSAGSPDEDDGGEWNQKASDANCSDDNDDDDDSDSYFGAPSRKNRPAEKKAAAGRAKRKGKGNISSDDDEDEDEGDDSDSDFGAPSRKKRPAKKASVSRAKGRGKGRKSPPKARSTPARSTRTTRATRSAHPEPSSEEEIQYETTPSGSRRPRRQCKSRTQEKMHDMVQRDMQSEREALADVLEEDDKELLEHSDRGGDSSEEEEAVGVAKGKGGPVRNKQAATPKKRGNKYDEDESYDEGAPSDANDSSDDDISDFEESDDGVSKLDTRKSARKKSTKITASYRDVDESDFGTADENSEDEAGGPSILMSPARKGSKGLGSYGSPNVRARARMGRSPLDVKEDDGSDSESDEESKKKKAKPRKKRRKLNAGSDDESDSSDGDASEGESSDASGEENAGKRKHVLLKSPYTKSPTTLKTTHIHCPSKTDDITMTCLPKNKPHVCYIAPDGKTRQCFALDTLYRIAISSPSANANNVPAALDNGDGLKQKLKFLQPPHFRSPMEDDLLDQIASRFGRSALVIENSAVYKKMKGHLHGGQFAAALDEELDEFDEDGEYVGSAPARRNFRDRFERYMQNLMGSTDVYCCPLCYNEADRRLGNGGDEEMWEDDEDLKDGAGEESEDRVSFLDDPLTILGSLDSDRFEVAASFCFRLLSGLKTHLRAVHGVNVSDVVGNDLFMRFQIRASDGLLQSWLKRSLRQNTVQGDMMRYWLNGENQSFVLLLSQIDRNALRGEQSGEYGGDFSVSFPNRAKRYWRDVSAPYLKDNRDMDDFIAEEGDDEEGGEDDAAAAGVPVNPNFTPPNGEGGEFKSPEEQVIEHLKKKNRGHPTFDDSDSSRSGDDGDDASSDEDLEVLPKPPHYEDADEEDEWTKSKMLKSKKATPTNRDRGGDSSEDDVFDAEEKPRGEANGSARKRVIDDVNGPGSDAEKPDPEAQAVNRSARKRVLESSDEESD